MGSEDRGVVMEDVAVIRAAQLVVPGQDDWKEGSEVALPVQGSRERHVVKGSGHGIGAGVGSHADDAVLRLVWRQLTAQLISEDVVLVGEEKNE